MQFDHPWFLLLWIAVPLFLLYTLRTEFRMTGIRKGLVISLRSLIISMLIFALAGTQLTTALKQQSVIYVVDRSDSMPDESNYTAWLRDSSIGKGERDRIAVVSTGLGSVVERTLTGEDLKSFSFQAGLNKQYSNLAQGMQLAGALASDHANSRIVLLTDGRENVGDMQRQANLLKDKGIPVDILPLPSASIKDTAVESVKLPEKLYMAEKYALEIRLSSTFAGQGELRIYEDNREISNQTIDLERGENRFALSGLAKEAGFHRYRAEIYVPDDEQSVNNVGYAFSRVTGPPKVLVVEGTPDTSANILSAMNSGLIPTEVITPEMMPRELADYAAYESIILNNVSATRMSESQMLMLEKAVSDYGVGLLVSGGEDSYGMGGYFKTPLERALPVYMELQGKREIPSLGLILVIDRSGSMSGEKIELAKEAAMRTVELMREKDTIGVVAFDSAPWWVVEPQKLTDKKKVISQIGSIQPEGGTEIYTAVDAGFQGLLNVDAQRKHIILLTDGQSATQMSYEQLTANMAKNNITMSTVGIGDGTDVQLLEYLAKLAKGRFYFTNDQSTLPAVLTRETVLLTRTYIVDQPFIPIAVQPGDWASMFAGGTPKINAYVATTPKETAEVVLSSPEPDPLLVRWQFGSGRSVAWTSDLTGKWSKEWTGWESFTQVFSQMVKWTFPQFGSSPYEISTTQAGSQIDLAIKSGDKSYKGDLKVEITDEQLMKQEVVVTPTIPGEYQGQFSVEKPGVYLTKLSSVGTSIGEGGESSEGSGSGKEEMTTGFVIPYSPEYRISAEDATAKLQQVADMTGGRMLTLEQPEVVFQEVAKARKQTFPLERLLLVLALVLWLVDIAAHRLSLPWERFGAWLAQLGRMNRRPVPAAAANRTTDQLLDRKKRSRITAIDAENAAGSAVSAMLQRGAEAATEAKKGDNKSIAPGTGTNAAGASMDLSTKADSSTNGGKSPEISESQNNMTRLLAAKNRKR